MSQIEKLILSRDFDDESPHFYRNPWALRCELGLGQGDAWTKSARERARAIYRLLFPRPADAALFDDWLIDYTFDELSGDVLNDAVYYRNLAVEEKFEVDVQEVVGAGDAYGTNARNTIMAGDDAYQLVAAHARLAFD